jgi:hypothetical protein
MKQTSESHRRWCLHASIYVVKIESKILWCSKCGAIYTGEHKRNQSGKSGKIWKQPGISTVLMLPKE